MSTNIPFQSHKHPHLLRTGEYRIMVYVWMGQEGCRTLTQHIRDHILPTDMLGAVIAERARRRILEDG